MYKAIFKYILDIIFSLVLLIILSPAVLVISILLIINNNGKLFFIQERPGKKEKRFYLLKFKTMNEIKDKDGNLLSDELRLTKFGNFLRKTSLDEIPQLVNVIRGEMSLVGPRPLLPEYLPLYNKKQKTRHSVKPGITGWAQVNGRNKISWEKRFEFDVWYVENASFILDLKILFMTIIKVLKREGINSGNTVTMEKFNGHN